TTANNPRSWRGTTARSYRWSRRSRSRGAGAHCRGVIVRGQQGLWSVEVPARGHVREPRVVALESDVERCRGTVTVLGDDQVGLTGADILVVDGVAVQQDHHVGILLDRSGFAKVADLRLLVLTRL